MTRLRSRRTAVAAPPYEQPLARRKRYGDSGRGAFADAYPQPGQADAADYRALLAAQLRRDRELTDLPDIARDDFETAAEYEQWLAEGAQRFSA